MNGFLDKKRKDRRMNRKKSIKERNAFLGKKMKMSKKMDVVESNTKKTDKKAMFMSNSGKERAFLTLKKLINKEYYNIAKLEKSIEFNKQKCIAVRLVLDCHISKKIHFQPPFESFFATKEKPKNKNDIMETIIRDNNRKVFILCEKQKKGL